MKMVYSKSLDDVHIIAALLRDVHTLHGVVFDNSARKNTTKIVFERVAQEGMSFLTKALPRLGKAFDRALTESEPLDSTALGFAAQSGSKLPMFIGELFNKVLDKDGRILPDACTNCVGIIRQILYLYYKYELPYTHEQEQLVVDRFERTENELSASSDWDNITNTDSGATTIGCRWRKSSNQAYTPKDKQEVIREAKTILSDLFAFFDPKNIVPRHGPGAVATKQRLWEKYQWSNVSANITKQYPLDAYFFASCGHVCDNIQELQALGELDLPAKVILVPKDSRGPRLISAEPVDYQWIQQGLGRAIVELCERHPLTKWNVHFTDQQPNQFGALLGSMNGKYATIDLNEASDRVSLDLVRLLFPEWLLPYLESARSSCTRLPDGRLLKLRKFAPMGSCLCFPILALTIYAILAATAPNADARESILVYGDDVIVPTAQAENAMNLLESFGLKINRDKSCTSGLFRESCGVDAFKGKNVTPVRFRTVWSSTRSPEVYTSWIAYANSFWRKRFYFTYDYIVERLHHVYGAIPSKDMHLACPSLEYVPEHLKPKRRRVNRNLQKLQYRVWDVSAPLIRKEINGWSMLLRWFTEGNKAVPDDLFRGSSAGGPSDFSDAPPFSVSSYTRRNTSMLVKRWR